MRSEARGLSLQDLERLQATYLIGPFRLDPVAQTLTRVGVPEPLGPRAVAVLAAIVARAPRPVLKDTIIAEAWPGLVVEENNLTVQIAAIRRALAKMPGGDRWVETIARRGYRFVGPVTPLPGGISRDADPSLGNVPIALTSFIGRERELVELKTLLAKNRLLTFVGPGGIGKTRLAMQLGGEVQDAYHDGVWFADFTALADPALVPNTLAQTLGVRQSADRALTDELCRRVKGQQLLLIFDNCEHVVDAAARLADALLHASGEPTILATSREPLRIGGEQVYRLPTLALPAADAEVESIRQSDSVLLFVDRAQHQQHDFALTPERASTVARLCVRLDGIPLALEFAAALVPTYSVDQIDARLDDRFNLLTQGSRTSLPRQQTLRATLDWSFELLSEEEQKVLRRASVFWGGFTATAAAEVVADRTLQSSRVDELLARLVARSLVNAEVIDGNIRYQLLDTTRAYAREKLHEAGEDVATQRRHAEHFARVLDAASRAWLRVPDAEWRTRYQPELDNVRTALEWSLASGGDASLAVALAGASGPLWPGLSLYGEGIGRLEAAAAFVPADVALSEQARLWLWLGFLTEASAPRRAVAAFRHALVLYRNVDDAEGVAQAAIWLARALATTGEYDESGAALAAALPAIERSGVPKLRAFYFANAGLLKTLTNDLTGAQAMHQAALELYREVGSPVGAAGSLNNLANVSWALGDLDTAENAFREAVVVHRQSGHRGKDPRGFTLGNLAGVLTERGKLAEALEAAREGLPLLRGAGNAWVLMDHLALRAALAGHFADSLKLAGFADAAHAAKESIREPNEARARKRVDEVARSRFDADTLAHYLAAGAQLSEAEACRLALEA
jgi:predicted ATPase/DNA-binding winged helix-turn-helix (wHTH) protein